MIGADSQMLSHCIWTEVEWSSPYLQGNLVLAHLALLLWTRSNGRTGCVQFSRGQMVTASVKPSPHSSSSSSPLMKRLSTLFFFFCSAWHHSFSTDIQIMVREFNLLLQFPNSFLDLGGKLRGVMLEQHSELSLSHLPPLAWKVKVALCVLLQKNQCFLFPLQKTFCTRG